MLLNRSCGIQGESRASSYYWEISIANICAQSVRSSGVALRSKYAQVHVVDGEVENLVDIPTQLETDIRPWNKFLLPRTQSLLPL